MGYRPIFVVACFTFLGGCNLFESVSDVRQDGGVPYMVGEADIGLNQGTSDAAAMRDGSARPQNDADSGTAADFGPGATDGGTVPRDTGPADAGGSMPTALICDNDCNGVCQQAGDPGCNTTCEGNADCGWVCFDETAGCTLTCTENATCTGSCPQGGCTMICRDNADCDFNCGGGNCTFVCEENTNCQAICSGRCTGPGG